MTEAFQARLAARREELRKALAKRLELVESECDNRPKLVFPVKRPGPRPAAWWES